MRTIIAVAMIALCSVMLTGCPEMTNTTEAPPIVKVGDSVLLYTSGSEKSITSGKITSITTQWIVVDGDQVFNTNNITKITIQ